MTSPGQPSSTDHGDLPRPLFSRYYASISPRMEAEGMGALRRELLADVRGEVVEIGCGNGLNFAHYPPTVTEVVAVEPEPRLRSLAESAATSSPVRVRVVPGTAGRLPLADNRMDSAVLCLVLCSFKDRAGALSELARVLRPDGALYFLEHCIAESRGLRLVQRIADATIWPLLAGGCHTSTDPLGLIEAAGLRLTAVRRLRFPDVWLTMPATPHVLGVARPA